jgi:hypothetical protein
MYCDLNVSKFYICIQEVSQCKQIGDYMEYQMSAF